MDSTETGGTAVATPPATTGKRRGPKEKSPTALQFALACNDPSVKTRQDAIDLMVKQGLEMSYSAFVNRVKSYTDPNRKGGPIKIKDFEAGQRGRRVDSAGINAQLAELAAKQAVKGEGEQATA